MRHCDPNFMARSFFPSHNLRTVVLEIPRNSATAETSIISWGGFGEVLLGGRESLIVAEAYQGQPQLKKMFLLELPGFERNRRVLQCYLALRRDLTLDPRAFWLSSRSPLCFSSFFVAGAFFLGRFQYGLLHFGQTDGSFSGSFGTHS
jgi:hypothetical protein